jgi:pyridoxine/pyridoxamine 5'-phosphate oxidase
MSDEMTTRPMLEALLDGQRELASQLVEVRGAIAAISDNQVSLAAKQDALAAKQDALAAKQDALAAKQDTLEVRVAELTRQVEDGFDDTNRKIEIFNDRMLSFESWLKRVDRRLHDEILVRTR